MSINVLNRRVHTLTLLTMAVSLGLFGCSDNDNFNGNIDDGTGDSTYAADIQRTEFGIPHITTKNYKGLGYGVGYAFAEDNICSLAREIVIAKGESMRYLGAEGNENSDVFYTWYNSPERRSGFLGAQDPEVIDAVKGYAAGYNRYLRDKGVKNIEDPACASAEWVREITTDDLLAPYGKANLRGGLSNFVTPIATAAPTVEKGIMGSSRRRTLSIEPENDLSPESAADLSSGFDFDMTTINVTDGGSNAYAFGSEVTGTKSGILYGNPHEPWDGLQRFYEFHLTLPGKLDVMGAGQQGQPFPNIGFNKDVAWSHTVSKHLE